MSTRFKKYPVNLKPNLLQTELFHVPRAACDCRGNEELIMDIILLEGLSPLEANLHDGAREIIGAESPGSRIWMLSDDHHFLYEGPPIDLERVSRCFLDNLLTARASDEDAYSKERQRPIVFVGIGIGGILVEQAIFLSHRMAEFTHIREHLAGVVFLGTPHGDDQDLGYIQILKGLGAGSTHYPETTADGLAVNSAYFNLLRSFFCDHIEAVPVYTITYPDSLIGDQYATLGCKGESCIVLDGNDQLSVLQQVSRCIQMIGKQHSGPNPIRRGGERAAAYTIEDLPPDICPICSTFRILDINASRYTAAFEHTISLAPSAQDELRLWARRCILANFAHRVSLDWLGCEPSGRGRGYEGRERTLWGNIACHDQQGVGYGGRCRSSSDDNDLGTLLWTLNFNRLNRESDWWAINTEQDDTRYKNGQRVVHRDPLSESGVRLVRSWIKLCDEVHESSEDGHTFLPSRLLDVRNLNKITLVDSINLGIQRDQIKYATLSHCWGSSRTFITTRQTLPRMKEGFSVTEEAIPKTFSDAITAAHKIGISYLWIDSLCIIQDDPGDWAVESSRMAGVYSNAYLTVSAACSESDETGFVHPRSFPYVTFKLISPTGEEAVVYLRRELREQVRPPLLILYEPLFERAWVFQEQFHSRRTLIFFKTEMAFYCRSFPAQDDPDFIRTESNTPEARAAVERNFMPIDKLSWRLINCDLSKRLLTYDSDKLPCIAGVASTFSAAREGTRREYCAGVWRDSLPADLLFCRGKKVQRPQTYTAPSWSWAALKGSIVWLGEAGEVNNAPDTPTEYETFGTLNSASVISCNIILEDERSPYGKVREGSSLTMKAHFVELESCPEDIVQGSGTCIPGMPSWQFEPRYLWPARARKVMGELFKFRFGGVERFVWCRFDLFSFGLKKIIGIPVAFRRWGFDESRMGQSADQLEEGDALVGILVTPLSGNGPRAGYRRVGVFEIPSAGFHPQRTLDGLPSETFVLY